MYLGPEKNDGRQVNKKFRKFERKYRDCIKRKGDKIGTQTCYDILMYPCTDNETSKDAKPQTKYIHDLIIHEMTYMYMYCMRWHTCTCIALRGVLTLVLQESQGLKTNIFVMLQLAMLSLHMLTFSLIVTMVTQLSSFIIHCWER